MDTVFDHGFGSEIHKILSSLKNRASKAKQFAVQTVLVTSPVTKVGWSAQSSIVLEFWSLINVLNRLCCWTAPLFWILLYPITDVGKTVISSYEASWAEQFWKGGCNVARDGTRRSIWPHGVSRCFKGKNCWSNKFPSYVLIIAIDHKPCIAFKEQTDIPFAQQLVDPWLCS